MRNKHTHTHPAKDSSISPPIAFVLVQAIASCCRTLLVIIVNFSLAAVADWIAAMRSWRENLRRYSFDTLSDVGLPSDAAVNFTLARARARERERERERERARESERERERESERERER